MYKEIEPTKSNTIPFTRLVEITRKRQVYPVWAIRRTEVVWRSSWIVEAEA